MGNRKKILEKSEKFLIKVEEFKNILIDGEPSTYYVSSRGYVINTNYRMTGKSRRLKDRVDDNGYHSVYLYKNNERISCKIHRLVAEAFIPNPENKPEVNHIDGDKSNNDMTNLEWATRSENMQHAVREGLHRALKDEVHPESVYSNDKIHEVCRLIATGKYSPTEISEKTGVSRSTVVTVAYKRGHTSISDMYDFTSFYSYENRSKYPERSWIYTEDQFHNVCKELVKNELTLREIADKTGVSYSMVKLVRLGKKKIEISSQYDFSHYNRGRVR